MTDRDRELQELKERLGQLEAHVDEIRSSARKPARSFWGNVIMSFIIVFVAMLISFGVFRFIKMP